jgi:hypothetical protein
VEDDVRWEDEAYVKVYTRDTPEFLLLSWQARCLFFELIRKVDRAGVLAVGKLGLKGVAVILRAPWEELKAPLEELVAAERIVFNADAGTVLLPSHIEAQSATQSDAARKRKSRDSARTRASQPVGGSNPDEGEVTDRDRSSRDVTDGHESGPLVTKSHAVSQVVTKEEKRIEEIRSPLPPEGGNGRIERTEAKTEIPEERRGVTPISRGAGTHFALETFGNIAKEILDGYALVNPNSAVGDILAAINGFAPPGLSREELVARMRFSVRRFLEQNRGNPYVKGGLQPKGWAEWLNANGWTLSKPVAVSNAPRAVPAVFAPDAKQIDPAWALAKLAELDNDVDA